MITGIDIDLQFTFFQPFAEMSRQSKQKPLRACIVYFLVFLGNDGDLWLTIFWYVYVFQEENNKYFREEKEDGAVYNVYLKKVVYNSFPEVREKLRKEREVFEKGNNVHDPRISFS